MILDENDNSPVFAQSEYIMNVLQDVPVAFELGRVLATDRDQNTNGRIRYSIIDDTSAGEVTLTLVLLSRRQFC